MSKAPLLIASLAMAAGSAAVNYAGQKKMAKQQDAANNTWLAFQDRAKKRAQLAENAQRNKANASFMEGLAGMEQEHLQGAVDEEAAALEGQWSDTAGLPDFASDARGSGQEEGRSGVFDAEMARSLNAAGNEARERMKALAGVTAYGGGGGAGGYMADLLRTSGEGIADANTERRGNIGVLQSHQAVQPEMFTYKPSPLVPLLSAGSALTGLAAGAGGFSELFSGGASTAPGMTFGNGLNSASKNLLPGQGGAGGLSFMPVPFSNNVVQY